MIQTLRARSGPWVLLSVMIVSVAYLGVSNAYADDQFDCCGQAGACVVVNRDKSCEGSGKCDLAGFDECCELACGTGGEGGGPPV